MNILSHQWGRSRPQDRVWAQVVGLPPSRAHKRLLMVFQAFIDDSYKPEGVYVLAGHIASAEVWGRFSQEWEELLPYGTRATDGGFHFKANEMMNNPERAERVGAFYRLIENSDLVSISCKINISDLNKAKDRLWVFGNRIDWGPFTDPFFFTFRALIDCVHSHRRTMPSLPQDDKIDFIFDDQSQKSMIISAWDKFLENRDPAVREMFGATSEIRK